jgi:hypothetical protein
MTGQEKLENVEYFKMMINDARCTREIESRIAMEKAALMLLLEELGVKT